MQSNTLADQFTALMFTLAMEHAATQRYNGALADNTMRRSLTQTDLLRRARFTMDSGGVALEFRDGSKLHKLVDTFGPKFAGMVSTEIERRNYTPPANPEARRFAKPVVGVSPDGRRFETKVVA